jgi:cytochrome P450
LTLIKNCQKNPGLLACLVNIGCAMLLFQEMGCKLNENCSNRDCMVTGVKNKNYKFPAGHNRLQSLLASVSFLKDPIGTISKNMQLFSGTYSGYLLGSGRFIITENPDFIQYILRDNHTNYEKSALSTKTAARLFGKGLLFSNGEAWLKQRRLIQPAFHQGKIQGLFEIVADTASLFVERMPEGEHLDLYQLMHNLSFTVLVHSLFDINLSEEMISGLSESFTDLQDFLLKDINQPLRRLVYPFNRADRTILRKSERIRKILKKIIEERRAEIDNHNDLLDMLLNVRYEDTGLNMAEDQIMDEISVLLFAGHETTANTLSWILYLLATHPEVARKLKSAITGVGIYESPKDEYINAVISEGMRLYPSAWMTERVALKDDQFGEFSYPKGTIIIPFFYGLHRNKKFWNEETEFKPERFIYSGPLKGKKIKNFFPFGAGPRMCIGNNFAMMEMAIVLHLMLSHFEILPTAEIPELWPLITLRPRRLHLGLKSIKANAMVVNEVS